jgi:hypothetical protein
VPMLRYADGPAVPGTCQKPFNLEGLTSLDVK